MYTHINVYEYIHYIYIYTNIYIYIYIYIYICVCVCLYISMISHLQTHMFWIPRQAKRQEVSASARGLRSSAGPGPGPGLPGERKGAVEKYSP